MKRLIKTSILFSLMAVLLLSNIKMRAQNDTIKLEEVFVISNRISFPFSKKSRTITLITAKEIKKSSATNVADLLQHIAGIDVRRRGIDGMQSDLYIRGGNFDQTLLLIDGIKMDDAQTGHHSMNAILSLDNIERIEIVKGPGARIYGQNAFTGAINIVTKKVYKDALSVQTHYGSYENKKVSASLAQKYEQGNILTSLSYQKADGYRFNTDFSTIAAFFKTNYKNYNFTSSFTERKFGANGFYASPVYKDQYEETQTSLVAVSRSYKSEKVKVTPRLYWRRNQDMYLFLRHNPSYFRNLHITNKVGVETNVVLNSSLGKTGIGIDFSRLFLVSNNLGNHQRTAITGFFEHRFEMLDADLDITPGVAVSYYSDFNTKLFPGLDVGYQVSDAVRLYVNVGYTYRVPTFTDLFYVGPTTKGNPNLQAESAFSEELGIKYKTHNFDFEFAFFQRTSDNLIDWTKDNQADKWETRNFSKVVTSGFETVFNYTIDTGKYKKNLKVAYNFIDDVIKDNQVQFTRYSLNSIRHQMTMSFDTKLTKVFDQSISYRYVERTDKENYHVVDAKLTATLKKGVFLSLVANNIFNAEYTETNLVPMPKGNMLLSLQYQIY